MDGVLVDVFGSYRTAIKLTAESFLEEEISFEEIQSYKEKIGFNNDWDLTEAIIISRGKAVEKKMIINKFQEFYLGKNYGGLIQNEKWMLDKKILSTLAEKYFLAIVTGRPREEAEYALRANGAENFFLALVAMEDVANGKPDPEGLLKALSFLGTKNAVYLGDTKNDEAAALNAKIEFIMVDNNSKNNVNKIARGFADE
ncbi:MAG: HAD-IA family hydrolase [archaeon]